MVTTIIAYILIILIVPTLSALVSYIVVPLLFLLKKISFPNFISMVIAGITNGFISIWLSIMMLNFFNKEAGMLLIIILVSVFLYHYNKGRDAGMLFGDILGLVIGWSIFVN